MYCFKHHGFCAVVRRPKNPKHKTQLVLPEAIRRRRSFELLVLSFELVDWWGILGGETHAMWWVEYILNAIVVVAERGGGGDSRGGSV